MSKLPTFEDYKEKELLECLLDENSLEDASFILQESVVTEASDKIISLMESNEITEEDIKNYLKNPTNEGVLGSILGGLTGFALGKTVGKVISNALGIDKGALYDLLTSRVVATAIGYKLGKRI